MSRGKENTAKSGKPEEVKIALQLLQAMPDAQRADMQKILPAFAATLAKSGQTVTAEMLEEHIAKGCDHLQQSLKTLKQNTAPQEKRQKTPLQRYSDIAASLLPELPETLEEQMQHAAKTGDLERLQALHQQGGDIRAKNDLALLLAAQNGHLDIIQYCVAQGGDLGAENDEALCLAAYKGHLDIVKYCVQQGRDIRAKDDYALRMAAENGQLDVVKYCVAQGCDIRANKDSALRHAAKNGHLDMVKYCVQQGCDIRADDDHVLRWTARNGQLDVVKYCVQQGGDVRMRNNNALHLAAEKGHLDVVKYCVQQGGDIRARNDDALLAAVQRGHLDVAAYCIEKGCDINILSEPQKDSFEKFDVWQKIHGTCPSGLHDLPPFYFKPKAFADTVGMIEQEGYTGKTANAYAYHAAGLFGTTERVVQYFEKWGVAGKQPLHDTVQHIRLPQEGRFNAAAWGDAVLKHGPKMARLVKFAGKLPEPLKNADGTWSYKKTWEELAKFSYENGVQHPALAAICLGYGWDDDDFEDAFKHIQKYQQKYAANDNKKPGNRIPEISIDGKDFDKDGYRFYKLPDGDLRGLFLGEMTNCCQHLANAGADCTGHGFLSEHSGFYVVEEEKTGEIIAQSWAWRGKDDALVLDSLESLGGHFSTAQWEKLAKTLADKIAEINENGGDITALNIGKGGATPKLSFNAAAKSSKPKKYNGYRDSDKQYQIRCYKI
ncbi:MAG: hypothetical protein EA357_01680 [Micavibrio sp.]|nr:MAG: hypothetical protein EA357_01680 [Micavibrio sp.]